MYNYTCNNKSTMKILAIILILISLSNIIFSISKIEKENITICLFTINILVNVTCLYLLAKVLTY